MSTTIPRSTEPQPRTAPAQVLRPEGFADALLAMPSVGDDADFERRDDLPRELDLR